MSERDRALRSIKNTPGYVEGILDTVREPLIILDEDLRVHSASRSFYRRFRVAPEETKERLVYELGNRQWDIPELRSLLEEVVAKNVSFDDFEVEHNFETMGQRIMILNARRVWSRMSQKPLVLLSIEDATERLMMEDALEYVASILATIRDPMIVLDEDLRVHGANRSFYRRFRVAPEETEGQMLYELGARQWDIPELRSLLEAAVTKKTPFDDFEVENSFPSIGHRIMVLNARRVRSTANRQPMILLSIEDATERITVEREEQAKRARFEEMERLAALGYWELDLVSNTLHWSDEIYRIFDMDPEKFGATYQAFMEVVHPDDREFVDKAYSESVKNKTVYDIIHRLLLHDGAIKYVHEKCKTEYNEEGSPVRSLGTVQDVTEQKSGEHGFAGLVGRSAKMKELFESIKQVTRAQFPVFLEGESGTGKELVAAAIHNEGPRANEQFGPVNCAALPDGLLESELFGHVKGAFTGAIRDKKGRFLLADRGSIFLDEIGDLSPAMQVKLLRILQEGTFEPVGAEKTVKVDVRVISATNKNLKKEVAAGRFREDLYYRICVIPITMPTLRERPIDIPLLVDTFLERMAKDWGGRECVLAPEALSLLVDYAWPGNVRELQNCLEFAMVKSRGEAVRPEHLPLAILSALRVPVVGKKRQGKLKPHAVGEALRQAKGNKLKAAKQLGVSRATLYRFLEKQEG